ncbi:MAG: hypothetical protein AAF666_05670 [Pseudomonadota bacterium]
MRNFQIIFSAIITLFTSPVFSADIHKVEKSSDPEEFARISLAGPISSGDARKIQALFNDEFRDYYNDTHYVTLTLNSPGGSFTEAIKLMDIFRKLQIATRVSADASCMSACAVAFLGGSRVIANTFSTSRTVEPGGKLGFHAPNLDLAGSAMVPSALLQQSYGEALSAISGLLKRRDEFDIRTSLVETIIATSPDDMYVVEIVDDFARWNITVELDQSNWQPDAADVARMCLNTAIWASGNSVTEVDESLSTQQGAPFTAVQVEDWAKRVKFYEPTEQQGIRSVFAYASEDGLEASTCVVKLVEFSGQWHPTVFWSDSSPDLSIKAAAQSNSSDSSYMLHALPHDFRIDALR